MARNITETYRKGVDGKHYAATNSLSCFHRLASTGSAHGAHTLFNPHLQHKYKGFYNFHIY